MTKIELDDGIALINDQDKLNKALLEYAKKHLKNNSEQYVSGVITFINDEIARIVTCYQQNWSNLETVNNTDLLAGFNGNLEKVLNLSADKTGKDKLIQQVMAIVTPLITEIDTYFRVSNRKGKQTDSDDNLADSLERMPIEPFNIYHAGYQSFHRQLASQIMEGETSKINAVITDPPYYINLATWDKELPDTSDDGSVSKESEFRDYLISVNQLLSEDAVLMLFNTYENVQLLNSLIEKMSADTRYPNFDYLVAPYEEWIKANPDNKSDAVYRQRSEYVSIAVRNTKSGLSRYARANQHMEYKVYESANPTNLFDDRKKKKINQTPKPPRMLMRLIQRYTTVEDTIIDSYSGSGSIMIAAYNLGREVYGCELSRYTQIKGTNRVSRFKRCVGQRALRDEAWEDLKGLDVDENEEELIKQSVWGNIRLISNTKSRVSLINEALCNVKSDVRQRLLNEKIQDEISKRDTLSENGRAQVERKQKRRVQTKQYDDTRITDTERGVLLGFGQVWASPDFKELFGMDCRDTNAVEKAFDQVALNLAIRYRHKHIQERETMDFVELMCQFSDELHDQKRRPTNDQIINYEHYLLQLLNDLNNYENEVQLNQLKYTSLPADEISVAESEKVRSEVEYYYRIVAILERTIIAIHQYLLAERTKNPKLGYGAETEYNFIPDVIAMRNEHLLNIGAWHHSTAEAIGSGHEEYFHDKLLNEEDTGNVWRQNGITAGNNYYDTFLENKLERENAHVFEVPSLNPRAIVVGLNLANKVAGKYSMYSLIGWTKGECKAKKAMDTEIVRKHFETKAEEKEYLTTEILILKKKYKSVAEIARRLMLTQATVNNYLKSK